MKISSFIKTLGTTKDTVRHYEELGMIQPSWSPHHRTYTEQDIQDFQAIKEMQELGMSLKEIQLIFELKRRNGCGSPELLESVSEKMVEMQQQIAIEELAIKQKKEQVAGMLAVLRTLNNGKD